MPGDCDRPLPSGSQLSLLHNHDAQEGENTTNSYTPWGITLTSGSAVSSLPSVRQPGFSITNQFFEGGRHLLDLQQPTPHVTDYWVDRFGLSLDSTTPENPSNSTSVLIRSPLIDGGDNSAAGAVTVNTNLRRDTLVSIFESQETSVPLPSLSNQVKSLPAQPSGVVRRQPRVVSARQRSMRRVYYRPGKKSAAEYEPDPVKLRASWQRRGGTDFACQWILTVFRDGVTLDALIRRLKLTEIEGMNFAGGFEPCLAYDGFLGKADDGFECCLCTVRERVWWKNKKDAVRHLRKFHFGLADQCSACHKFFYSTGEMNSHRCGPSSAEPSRSSRRRGTTTES